MANNWRKAVTYICFGVVLFALTSCQTGKRVTANKPSSGSSLLSITSPPVLVYTTKADYHDRVPVLLSADKKRIISYPAPSDIRNIPGYPLPGRLQEGYLLDKRGIGMDVAYLNLTYKEFAALNEAPSLQEMMDMIIDDDPLTSLYNCGESKAYGELEEDLNKLIVEGRLKKVCRKLK